MREELIKSFGVPISFFIGGIVFLIIGGNGERIASSISRSGNETVWSTSQSLINACTYIPTIIGISLLLVFVTTFSIAYFYWKKHS